MSYYTNFLGIIVLFRPKHPIKTNSTLNLSVEYASTPHLELADLDVWLENNPLNTP